MIAPASAPMTAQQAKMVSATRRPPASGDAREAFMKTCLSAEAPMSPQDKTKK
jgi:hypothetical protein